MPDAVDPTRSDAAVAAHTGRARTSLAPGTQRMLAAAAAIVCAAAWALAAGGDLAPGERAAFEAVNAWPAVVSTVLWPVVQLGSVLLVPAMALVAVVLADGRAGARVAASGLGAWACAEVAKAVVDRPRPAGLLHDVVVRGEASSGPGFPSGHAAVGAAVAIAVVPLVPARWRPLLALLPLLIGLGRTASGVHLPLDVVGGAAIGVLVGLVVDRIAARLGRLA